MGGTRHRQTERCKFALLLLGVIALVVSLAGAHAPVTNRISNPPANGPHISQRAEEPALHVIYPKNRENKSQTDAITKLLDGLVVDKTTIYASESKYLGIFFWSAPLTKSQVATVKAHPYVSSIGVQCVRDCYDPMLGHTGDDDTVLEKGDGGLVKERDAVPGMVLISTQEEL